MTASSIPANMKNRLHYFPGIIFLECIILALEALSHFAIDILYDVYEHPYIKIREFWSFSIYKSVLASGKCLLSQEERYCYIRIHITLFALTNCKIIPSFKLETTLGSFSSLACSQEQSPCINRPVVAKAETRGILASNKRDFSSVAATLSRLHFPISYTLQFLRYQGRMGWIMTGTMYVTASITNNRYPIL